MLNDIGIKGEIAALKFYVQNGYAFLEKNYRSKYGEIDIILKNSEYIVFSEVKTRKPDTFGKPSESVDIRKRKRIIKTASEYLSENPTDLQPRFDVTEVIYDAHGHFFINNIENAFYQSDDYAAF